MKAFLAFSKKEILEYVRTYKLFILIMIFLALGFLNPITAKYLPELVATVMPEGMMNIPEPTLLDSWAQFFKNIPQMGLVILIIMLGGIMSNELTKGTLINVLTKGLPRSTVILSKGFIATLLWSLCYGMSFFVSYLYNMVFWRDSYVPYLLSSVSFVWIFGILMITLIILGNILTKSMAGGLLLAGGFYVINMILSMFESISSYSPIYLVTQNMALINQQMHMSDFIPSLVVTFLLILISYGLSILCFQKKQL